MVVATAVVNLQLFYFIRIYNLIPGFLSFRVLLLSSLNLGLCKVRFTACHGVALSSPFPESLDI